MATTLALCALGGTALLAAIELFARRWSTREIGGDVALLVAAVAASGGVALVVAAVATLRIGVSVALLAAAVTGIAGLATALVSPPSRTATGGGRPPTPPTSR